MSVTLRGATPYHYRCTACRKLHPHGRSCPHCKDTGRVDLIDLSALATLAHNLAIVERVLGRRSDWRER